MTCVSMCVCGYMSNELHMTAQPGPVMSYAKLFVRVSPRRDLCVCVYLLNCT